MRVEPKPEGLVRFLVGIFAFAFVLNWFWEMAQMTAYREMASRPWGETSGLCARATLGDVAITLLIYSTGALAAGALRWGLQSRWNVYSAAALLGAMHAFWIERAGIGFGRWAYMQTMPMVPMLKIGLWPFLQLTLLTPLTFWLSGRCAVAGRTH